MNAASLIPAAAGPARFTTVEFSRMMESGAFEDMWVELVERELELRPPPGNTHAQWQMAVVAELLRLVSRVLVRADIGIDLGEGTTLAADAALLKHPVTADGLLPAAAVALAVEVAVSTRDRDLGMKRPLYAAAGVPNYWVVDPDRALVHVFGRPEREDYMALSLVRFGEPLPVPGSDGAITLT